MSGRPLPPDEDDRRLIRTALDDNLLVEAGAGSGKTTALVDRMLRLVAHGHAGVEEIAAVTFTRKAAGELRQRFQERLEGAVAQGRLDPGGPPADPDVLRRLATALGRLDRAFMGTIHAFCARLLRERPLDARLDPAFRELTVPEEHTLTRRFWDDYLERLAGDDEGSRLLARLDAVGLRPSQLWDPFRRMNETSDVTFPVEDAPAPAGDLVERVWRQIESIVADSVEGLPRTPPAKGWDSLQKRVRQIRYLTAVLDFKDPTSVLRAVEILCSSRGAKVTLNRWEVDGGRVKELRDRTNALIEVTDERPEPPARKLLHQWWAHRYQPVMELLQGAARDFAAHRRRTGQLTFHDLLVLATELLRRSPGARAGLGERWRRILVDEFQDTDPLQAELLFLLASDPTDDPPPAPDGRVPWARLVPRPGALFVVGDPKQSIYRFRRADISLYGRVRDRFRDFGQVVHLDANFRSTAPIGEVVAGVFAPGEGGGLFPAEGTPRQAGYAPLLTQPRGEPPVAQGVFTYEIPKAHTRPVGALTQWEADALADWIAGRVASGERAPDDFLILTRKRRHLATYARALEARHVPVLVSGSGVGIDDELRELRTLLQALVDPGDPLGVLAALEGLFFGLDPEQLLTHVESGGSMDYRRTQPPGPVADALARMAAWWEMARSRPADEVVDDVVASVGLLPWAASGELGGLRAGALAFTLDLVRTAAVSDDASLAGALDALALVLDDEDSEVESPLEPGRGGAVRLMNLHKAKGLEAPVVILACPTGSTPLGRSLVVERDDDGTSVGWCAVEERGNWSSQTLAAPRDWVERQEREVAFEEAEEDRLLYVAVTRAAEELVVGRKEGSGKDRGPWGKLEGWLARHADPLVIAPTAPPPRQELDVAPATLRAREREAHDRRTRAGEAGHTFDTVTGVIRVDDGPPEIPDLFADVGPGAPVDRPGDPALGWTQTPGDGSGPGGFAWGNAVHLTLDAALSGLEGAALTAVARTALLDNERPVADGEPLELEALLTLVDRVQGSELWQRALAADVRLTEQPFVLEREDGRYLEGVIDLAFREPDGWVIVDYKTAADDRVFQLRLPGYRRQVALYGEAWRRLTGEPVAETLVWRVG